MEEVDKKAKKMICFSLEDDYKCPSRQGQLMVGRGRVGRIIIR